MTTELTPISTPEDGQAFCTSRGPVNLPDPDKMSCTREHGHELPHEAAGTGGTVYARWVDWSNDSFDSGRTAPVVVPAISRPARIAALHMAGLFLAEHVDLPMPEQVSMDVHGMTATQLQAMADLHGVPIRHTENYAYVEIVVGLETLHGISIRYLAFGARA